MKEILQTPLGGGLLLVGSILLIAALAFLIPRRKK